MKRTSVLVLALLLSMSQSSFAATKPVAGAKCTKSGLTVIYGGKKYVCIALGKSLYWNNGVKVISEKPAAATPTDPQKILADAVAQLAAANAKLAGKSEATQKAAGSKAAAEIANAQKAAAEKAAAEKAAAELSTIQKEAAEKLAAAEKAAAESNAQKLADRLAAELAAQNAEKRKKDLEINFSGYPLVTQFKSQDAFLQAVYNYYNWDFALNSQNVVAVSASIDFQGPATYEIDCLAAKVEEMGYWSLKPSISCSPLSSGKYRLKIANMTPNSSYTFSIAWKLKDGSFGDSKWINLVTPGEPSPATPSAPRIP